ncbi:MAG: hypothetical protein QOJ00_686, partial [Actinomycetota bacterium]
HDLAGRREGVDCCFGVGCSPHHFAVLKDAGRITHWLGQGVKVARHPRILPDIACG